MVASAEAEMVASAEANGTLEAAGSSSTSNRAPASTHNRVKHMQRQAGQGNRTWDVAQRGVHEGATRVKELSPEVYAQLKGKEHRQPRGLHEEQPAPKDTPLGGFRRLVAKDATALVFFERVPDALRRKVHGAA